MPRTNSSDMKELRHERKFLVREYSYNEILQFIRLNPACFTEIYHQRQINNIYFDSFSFDSYYGNVEGDISRFKARIRWYGPLFGMIAEPVLEFKIKNGLLGTKEHYPLGKFILDRNFSRAQISGSLRAADIPANVKDLLHGLQPVLLNSYTRKYYLSADKHFRLTIDRDLQFYGISYNGNSFLNRVNSPGIVIELKYDTSVSEDADQVSGAFPFALTKNSKYLQGVESVLF
jgi:hypothetical protein